MKFEIQTPSTKFHTKKKFQVHMHMLLHEKNWEFVFYCTYYAHEFVIFYDFLQDEFKFQIWWHCTHIMPMICYHMLCVSF